MTEPTNNNRTDSTGGTPARHMARRVALLATTLPLLVLVIYLGALALLAGRADAQDSSGATDGPAREATTAEQTSTSEPSQPANPGGSNMPGGISIENGVIRMSGIRVGGGCVQVGMITVGDCPGSGGSRHTTSGGIDIPHMPQTTSGESTGQTSIIERTQIGGGAASDQYDSQTASPQPSTQQSATPNESSTPLTTTSQQTGAPRQGDSGGDAAASCPTRPSGDVAEVTVTRVLDGDTFDARGSDDKLYDVREIGVDAPELAHDGHDAQPYAEQSAAFTKKALDGQKLLLEYDRDRVDSYGRALAYVWTRTDSHDGGHQLFERAQLEAGQAEVREVEPDTVYRDCFEAAEQQARQSESGMWALRDSGGGGSRSGGD